MAFYRTKITFEVLSEDPIPGNMSIEGIVSEADIGAFVMSNENREQVEISGKEAADDLYSFGSDPSFFQLNEEGEHDDAL